MNQPTPPGRVTNGQLPADSNGAASAEPGDPGPVVAAEEGGADDEGGKVVPLPSPAAELEPAPGPVAELADACVRFVRAAVGVELDFSAETLPVLDHYLATRRDELLAARASNPEAMGLIARAAGAYFGEVVRRHFASFWNLASEDTSSWEVRFEAVYLSVNPLAVVYDAISHGDEEGPIAYLELEEEDRDAVAARLSELPPASDEEFFSLATRLEVLEIAVDVIKSRMMAAGLGEVAFSGEDYEN